MRGGYKLPVPPLYRATLSAISCRARGGRKRDDARSAWKELRGCPSRATRVGGSSSRAGTTRRQDGRTPSFEPEIDRSGDLLGGEFSRNTHDPKRAVDPMRCVRRAVGVIEAEEAKCRAVLFESSPGTAVDRDDLCIAAPNQHEGENDEPRRSDETPDGETPETRRRDAKSKHRSADYRKSASFATIERCHASKRTSGR